MKHSYSQTSMRTENKMVIKSIMLGMTLIAANISVASAALLPATWASRVITVFPAVVILPVQRPSVSIRPLAPAVYAI